jgi:hypothetical protein
LIAARPAGIHRLERGAAAPRDEALVKLRSPFP